MTLRACEAVARGSSRRGDVRQVWTALLGLVAFLPSCATVSETGDLEATAQWTRLTSDLSQLQNWFAQNDRRPRAVALLSPT